jgi:methanethiol S-methyltransferase
MSGILSLMYGVVSYAIGLVAILYAIGFVGNLVVPKTIDSGAASPMAEALVVNVLLLGLFAVQHSVMARPAFKRWWTRMVPPAVERSTYVLFAGLVLALLYWQWRPLPMPVWTIENRVGVIALGVVFWLGWGVLFLSTFLINHFELFGLRQVYARLLNRKVPEQAFTTPLLYRHVRHPIYLGLLMSFWATPNMTAGHLLFCLATTGYILLGIQLEEHDLIGQFGDRYRLYRQQVGMLLPRPRAGRSRDPESGN